MTGPNTGICSTPTATDYSTSYVHTIRYLPRKIYSTTTYPLTDIAWTFPQVNSVADSIVADFDNNGEMDVLLMSNTQLRPSGVSQPSAKVMEALLSNGNKGFNFVSGGKVTVKLDWNRSGASDGSSTDFTRVVVGANRMQLVTASPFTLDSTDPNVQGVPPTDPTQVPTLRIGYDAAANPPRWVFVVDSIDDTGAQVFSEAYLQVSATQNITSLQTSGLWPGDGVGVPTLLLDDSRFNDATAGSGLDQPISCVSAAVGDFDNDMDVDLYISVPHRRREHRQSLL